MAVANGRCFSVFCEFGVSRAGISRPSSLEDSRESVLVLRTDALVDVEHSHEGRPLNLEKAVETSKPHLLHDDPRSPGAQPPQSYLDSPPTKDKSHNRPEGLPMPRVTPPTLRRRRPIPAAPSTTSSLSLPSSSSSASAFVPTSSRTTISTLPHTSATTTVSTSSGLSSRRPNNVAMIAGTLVAAIAIIASFIVIFLVGCRRHKRRRHYSDSPSLDPESTARCPTGNPSVSSLRLVPLDTHAGSLRAVRASGSRSEAPRATVSEGPQHNHLGTDDPPEYDHIPHPPVAARIPETAVK